MSNQLCRWEPECSVSLCSEIACLVPKLRAKTEERVIWERNLAIGCDLGTHAFFAFLPNDSNAAQNFRCHRLHSRPSDWKLWQKNLQKLQNLAWMWMTIHRHLGWEPYTKLRHIVKYFGWESWCKIAAPSTNELGLRTLTVTKRHPKWEASAQNSIRKKVQWPPLPAPVTVSCQKCIVKQ